MKVNITICPPYHNTTEYLEKQMPNFNEIKMISSVDLIKHDDKKIIDLLQDSEEIVVDGMNTTRDERSRIINKLKYLFGEDKIVVKYWLFSISKEKVLYHMFLNNNKNMQTLPVYLYYYYLDTSDLNENNSKVINLSSDYDYLLKHGSIAVIVDIQSFLLNSLYNKTLGNLPRTNEYLYVNYKLCDILKKLYEKGIQIYISNCDTQKYSHITKENLVKLYDEIIAGIGVDVHGISCGFNGSIKNNRYKPNPYHFFEMFQKFNINPYYSLYLGSQDIDEEFAKNAGINNYINCSKIEGLEKINKYFQD